MMNSRLKPVPALVLVLPFVLACHSEAPVAQLQISPRTLTLSYAHGVPVELTWLPRRSLGVGPDGLMVYVHLKDQDGNLQRTFDHPFPGTWTAGDEVVYSLDLFQSATAPPLPPGRYGLTAGLYTASGRRWDLDAAKRGDEQVPPPQAEVEVPYPVTPRPRFGFARGWDAPHATGVRQIVATRWLKDRAAAVEIWGVDKPGEAVLSFSILRLQEQDFRLRTDTPAAAPTVAVTSDCGEVRGRLSGYGSHEIRVTVPGVPPTQGCRIRFVPGFHFADAEGSRRVSALLESAVWFPATAAHEDKGEFLHRRLITQAPTVWDLSLPRPMAPETITLRNLGDEVVAGPRVIVNGRKDWFDIDSMLAEIVEPGSSDREKALAIWRFLVANRYHDYPTHHHFEMHDPVRLLNVYGYGFCDDTSTSFMRLAHKAGLKARIWHLGGHVVSEAFYDGAWHMLDADGEVYYRLGRDDTIASVRQLASNPDLVRRHPSPNSAYHNTERLAERYASKGNNRIAGWYDGVSRHVMTFDLRPGESILRSRKNWGLHVPNRSGTEPEFYGNGRFSFEPVLRDGLYRKGATEVAGVEVETVGADRRLVFASDAAGGRARLTYPFVRPYPLLVGRARIVGELSGAGTVELLLSADGEQWSQIWSSSGDGEVDEHVVYDPFFSRAPERPRYRYHLSMVYAGHAEGSRWRVETLRFESDFQLAPHALPSFEQGPNEVRYVDSGDAERAVELIFGFGG